MKKMFFIAAMLVMAGVATAQEIIKSTEIGDFQTITLTGNLIVELVPAEANGIEVNLYDSAADKFRWNVKDGVLAIALRPTVGQKPRAEVRIHYKSALQVVSATESRLTSAKPIKAHCLRIELSSGASASLDIDVQDLELEARGNSAVAIKGTAKYLDISALERSNIDGKGLSSTSAEVTATLGSEVFVNATERLVALSRSGAAIYYTGAPAILKNLSLRNGAGGSVFSIGESIKR
jgi:hypothetical protein